MSLLDSLRNQIIVGDEGDQNGLNTNQNGGSWGVNGNQNGAYSDQAATNPAPIITPQEPSVSAIVDTRSGNSANTEGSVNDSMRVPTEREASTNTQEAGRGATDEDATGLIEQIAEIGEYYRKYGNDFYEKMSDGLQRQYDTLLDRQPQDAEGRYIDPITGEQTINLSVYEGANGKDAVKIDVPVLNDATGAESSVFIKRAMLDLAKEDRLIDVAMWQSWQKLVVKHPIRQGAPLVGQMGKLGSATRFWRI